MLVLGKRCKTRKQAWSLLEGALADGSALAVFRRLVKAQGGDVRVADDPSRLPQSSVRRIVKAPKAGYVTAIDAYTLGVLAIELGAGRTRADQKLDPAAGFELHAKLGASVERGAALLTIHAARRELAQSVEDRASVAFQLGARAPKRRPLVLEHIR